MRTAPGRLLGADVRTESFIRRVVTVLYCPVAAFSPRQILDTCDRIAKFKRPASPTRPAGRSACPSPAGPWTSTSR